MSSQRRDDMMLMLQQLRYKRHMLTGCIGEWEQKLVEHDREVGLKRARRLPWSTFVEAASQSELAWRRRDRHDLDYGRVSCANEHCLHQKRFHRLTTLPDPVAGYTWHLCDVCVYDERMKTKVLNQGATDAMKSGSVLIDPEHYEQNLLVIDVDDNDDE